ncbi:hypothetical protein D2E76_16685 [Mycobacteroides abscessus]|uniref:Uncharacterized protein n=1 Tax=Mycobacteroides abscessus TaxID=36809 RepID=A0ABD7HM34_9MYCO|nr:hypothetical protein D2E76_16685 [Mycobacteroides abscessus]
MLPPGAPSDPIFKRYPVVVTKPIYIPLADDRSCIGKETQKRLIAWISGISVEVKARQPLDVWAMGVMRQNINGETYDVEVIFAAFENIKYSELVEMAAVFKLWEPENLILDEGRYPPLNAFVPTAEMVRNSIGYASKIKEAKAKNPDFNTWRHDGEAQSAPRHAAADTAAAGATSTTVAQAEDKDGGDIEGWL